MIRRLYELLTGKPYITTRSMSAEFGPPPAALYPELADYSDWELIVRDRAEIIAEIEERRRAIAALLEQARREVVR